MRALHFSGEDFLMGEDELDPELADALRACGAPGSAVYAVVCVRAKFDISGDPFACRKYLEGYGAWDADELEDHEANLDRLVWLAGCDLREQSEIYFSAY